LWIERNLEMLRFDRIGGMMLRSAAVFGSTGSSPRTRAVASARSGAGSVAAASTRS